MTEEKIVFRKVSDLGACAYLLMHGFNIDSKQERNVFVFSMPEKDVKEFEDKEVEYLKSEFHRFDACLMSLKKWRSNTY